MEKRIGEDIVPSAEAARTKYYETKLKRRGASYYLTMADHVIDSPQNFSPAYMTQVIGVLKVLAQQAEKKKPVSIELLERKIEDLIARNEDLVRSNNALLGHAREAEAKLKELEGELESLRKNQAAETSAQTKADTAEPSGEGNDLKRRFDSLMETIASQNRDPGDSQMEEAIRKFFEDAFPECKGRVSVIRIGRGSANGFLNPLDFRI